MTSRGMRARTLGLAVATLATTALVLQHGADAASTADFTGTKTVTRTHLVAGQDEQVDKRDVTVTVSDTKALRDRQTISVSWSGAHPTGGLFADVNSGAAAAQEYPVVILECRGTDSRSVPASQRVRPETCWTSTPLERYNSSDFLFPPWRVDRYEAAADRTGSPGQPDPVPNECLPFLGSGAGRWLAFDAADGTVYRGGGGNGCAGIPPEAVLVEGAVPSNQTYGQSDEHGNGSAKFVVQSADSNASLGCTDKVACSLVVIPVMGIACDVTAAGLPALDRPETYGDGVVTKTTSECTKAGHYAAGELNSGIGQEDLAVSGSLWWAESNWRNRITVPLRMAQSPSVCSVLNTSAPAYVYGSEIMLQTSLQWAPHFCLDKSLFKFQHVQTPEPVAKNLLDTGSVDAAFQALPPDTPFSRRTVQAPVAYTGFAIAADVDDVDGHALPDVKLTPRLLAKLLTESYLSNANIRGDIADLKDSDPERKIVDNPLTISRDPEFVALNPTARRDPYFQEAAATLLVMSSDSDVMVSLTEYIDADPDARAWLDGQPDPWGMVVNPSYKGIDLPLDSWPLLDSLVSRNMVTAGNSCLEASPVPWLPLVASPVSQMSAITLAMQYGTANSAIVCSNPGQPNQRLKALGRQSPGSRFTLGLVPLGDAARYQLTTAALLSHTTADAASKFTDAAGRTFVQPTDASLSATAPFFAADKDVNSWVLDYGHLRGAPGGAAAYPGTLLMSLDVPTTGLPKAAAARYAQLMRFAVGPGQSRGVLAGQLAPGFVPLTRANGLGDQLAYTLRAATAVAAQDNALPLVTGGQLAGNKPPAGSGGGTGPGTGGGSGAGSTGGGAPGSGPAAPPAAGPTPSGSASPGAQPSPPTQPLRAAPVGVTQGASSGVAGLLLPLVLGLALACGLTIPLTNLLARLRGRP